MAQGEDFQKVLKYIEENVEKTVADLQELCRQPSISTTNVGIKEMANLLHARIEKAGLSSSFNETAGNPILTAKIEGASEKTLLFYNHYDVQPADPESEWASPPFEANIIDEHVVARGSTDNKGNIISRLVAFEAFLGPL
mgnify:FL=1